MKEIIPEKPSDLNLVGIAIRLDKYHGDMSPLDEDSDYKSSEQRRAELDELREQRKTQVHQNPKPEKTNPVYCSTRTIVISHGKIKIYN